MEALKKNLSKIIVPNESQPIYKSKCIYSNDSPESPTGLYVNLTTYLGFSEGYAERYAEKTANVVFLHIKRIIQLKQDGSVLSDQTANHECGPEQKTTHHAVDVEGGYNEAHAKKYEFKDTYSIVVMPDKDNKLPYPNQELPMKVTQAVEALLSADSAITKSEKLAAGSWDGEMRQVSKFAEELKQLDNGKKIAPSGWKCEKCDLTNNLWLNLTDGSILCGRKFFDGSGGNDHAVQYYKETGFPLAVKLGTIRADGKLDVFSYPEDDMVIDPKLNEHLAHFGINMNAMKKSEKSMVEMELDITQLIGEWSLLTESESENELHFINAFL